MSQETAVQHVNEAPDNSDSLQAVEYIKTVQH